MVTEKTPEELLTEHKEQIFLGNMEESKKKQRLIISHCNNEIEYFQSQITKLELQKQDAQALLDELESRYPLED